MQRTTFETPTLGLYQPRAPRAVAAPLLPGLRGVVLGGGLLWAPPRAQPRAARHECGAPPRVPPTYRLCHAVASRHSYRVVELAQRVWGGVKDLLPQRNSSTDSHISYSIPSYSSRTLHTHLTRLSSCDCTSTGAIKLQTSFGNVLYPAVFLTSPGRGDFELSLCRAFVSSR